MFIFNTLKIALRAFRNDLKTSMIKVIGLTVSVASVLLIWSFVMKENRVDKNLVNSSNIFRLDAHWASMPPVIGDEIARNISDVAVTRMNFSTDVGVQVGEDPFNIPDLMFADSTFFKVIPFVFVEGESSEALVRPFSIVLTESVARRLFGTTQVLGKIVKMENEVDFTITGVISDNPFIHLKIEVIASIVTLEKIVSPGVLRAYDGWSYPTYLTLPDKADKANYEKRINDLLHKMRYEQDFHLKPFADIYYSSEMENESNTKHGNLTYNRVLISVSVFILLLAAVNFINLTIAGALSRSKEVSIRKVQGAPRTILVMQFLIETAMYVFISVLSAFLLLWFIDPVLALITGFSLDFRDFINTGNLSILVSGILIFVLLAGIYPGIHISQFNIITLKSISLSGGRFIRNGLIVFQNIVSITLICCTLIAYSQFRYIKRKDLGFSKENVVILKLNSQLKQHKDLFSEKLNLLPGISGVTFSSRIPGNYWGSWCCVKVEGEENKYFNNYVDPSYLETLGIGLKEGRNFSAVNAADLKTTYLINETAIEQYDLKNPIGQVITPGNGISGTIIGIINDFHYRGLQYEKTPVLFFNTDEYKNYVNIKISGDDTESALRSIAAVWEEICPAVWEEICPAFTFDYKFLDETFELQYKSERRFESLIFFFAVLSMFIAGLGLLGITIFISERRIKEIGVRKVNGARTAEIILMLNKDVIPWIVFALIVAWPIAWYIMSVWLQGFVYRTTVSFWVFAASAVISLTLAFLTVSLQSWKTAAGNPVNALRSE